MSGETYILSRIQAIEAELAELKRQVDGKPKRDMKSLYGILEGLVVDEDDFDRAKRSWSKEDPNNDG